MLVKRQIPLLTAALGMALLVSACAPAAAPARPPAPPIADAAPGGATSQPSSSEPGNTPSPAPLPEKPAGPRISVEDESTRIPELSAFVQSLREVVAARDRDRLMAMISPKIKYSFGINEGKQGFIKQWKLDSSPADSLLWPDLEEILSLGGVLSNDRLYFAPNFFVHFPEGYDQFDYLAVIGEGVAVRQAPEPGADVLDRLSYTVVKAKGAERVGSAVEVDGKSYAWVPVVLPDGRQGYILDKYVRHPLEARLGIGKADQGKWEIEALVAGD